MEFKDLIVRQLKTEKSLGGERSGKYVFLVRENADKNRLKEELADYFKVKIVKINTLKDHFAQRFLAKYHRTVKGPTFKKAVVTLAEGQTLPVAVDKVDRKERKEAKK